MKIFSVLLVLTLSSSAAFGEMYTWKDARGTVFYTNSLHEIPARYLKRARVLDVATGKKGGPATAQPAVPSGSALPTGPAQAPLAQAPQPAQPAQPAAPPAPPAPIPAQPVPAVADPVRVPSAGVTAPSPQQRTTTKARRAQRRQSSDNEE